jgi:hypothetical protein
MPKATSLTPEALETPQTIPLAATKQRGQKAETDKIEPLQIRIPHSQVKAIKMAALEAEQTVSDFMLACFHAYIEKRKHGKEKAWKHGIIGTIDPVTLPSMVVLSM